MIQSPKRGGLNGRVFDMRGADRLDPFSSCYAADHSRSVRRSDALRLQIDGIGKLSAIQAPLQGDVCFESATQFVLDALAVCDAITWCAAVARTIGLEAI